MCVIQNNYKLHDRKLKSNIHINIHQNFNALTTISLDTIKDVKETNKICVSYYMNKYSSHSHICICTNIYYAYIYVSF